MKQYRFFMMALALILLMASPAMAKYVPVTIWNNTGKTMTHLYLTLSGSNSWNEDILGPEDMNIKKLRTTEYIEIDVQDAPTWDVRAEFSDGTIQEYYEISFRKSRGITLNRNSFAYD